MQNKDLTQQIVDKAKAAHLEREATLKEAKRIPMSSEYCDGYEKGFTAGAQYALSLQEDIIADVAEWLSDEGAIGLSHDGKGNWYNLEGQIECTSAELATKYLSHLNPIKKDCQE